MTKAQREQERQDWNLSSSIFHRMYPHFPCHGQTLTKAQENHRKWVIAAVIEGVKAGRKSRGKDSANG